MKRLNLFNEDRQYHNIWYSNHIWHVWTIFLYFILTFCWFSAQRQNRSVKKRWTTKTKHPFLFFIFLQLIITHGLGQSFSVTPSPSFATATILLFFSLKICAFTVYKVMKSSIFDVEKWDHKGVFTLVAMVNNVICVPLIRLLIPPCTLRQCSWNQL